MRSLLFLTILSLASLAAAEVKPCAAKETPSSDGTTFEFTGTVHAGELFSCTFAKQLDFRLVPVTDGWQIDVQPVFLDQNLVFGNKSNAFDPTILSAGSSNAVHLNDERTFSVLLNLGSTNVVPRTGNSSLQITGLKLDPASDKPPAIEELSFSTTIQIRTFNGLPVYTVGGAVKPPAIRSAPDPKYSDQAREERLQGTVVLSALISAEGKVGKVEVLRPLGLGLDEQAVRAVRHWKFRPATLNGHPVPVQISVEVNFRI